MRSVEKRGRVYLLTLTGAGEHRLNPTLLDSITSALAQIRSDSSLAKGSGSALVTCGEGKFFSNGFDLAWATSSSSPSERVDLLSSSFIRAVSSLLSLPMPTFAAVTGHAAAAGFALALAHDYVAMREDRGFLYMSEVDIGVPMVGYFITLIRSKIREPRVLRDVVMRGEKITAARGVGMGIVDEACGSADETVERAVRMGEELARRDWDGEVYASIRMGALSELCAALGMPTVVTEEEEQKKRSLIGSRL